MMSNEIQQNEQEVVSVETTEVTESEATAVTQEPEVPEVKRPSLITKEAYLESVKKVNNPDFKAKAIEFTSRDNVQDALIEEINKAFSVKRAEVKFELDTNPNPTITISVDLDKLFTLASKDFSMLSVVGSKVGKGIMRSVLVHVIFNIFGTDWEVVDMAMTDEAIQVKVKL